MSYNASLTGAGWLVDPIINPKSGTPSAPYIATLNQDGWNVQPIVKPVAPPALGPELLVNGDFESGQSPWTVSGADATHIVTFTDGKMRYQSGATSPQLIVLQGVPTGKTYEATFIVSAWASGSVKTDSLGTGANSAINGVGTFIRRGAAIGSTFAITRGSANVDITFDSISLKEVLA